MKTAFVSLATAALLIARVAGQLQINTPANVVVCQPIQLTWSGGTAPYFLSVLPGATPSGTALEDLGQQSGTSLTWLVDIAAGTSIGLTLRDSTGTTAQSAAFTINSGTDTSCIGKNSLSSSSASSTSAVSSTSGTASVTSTTGSVTSTTSVSVSKSTGTTTTPSASKASSTAPSTSAGKTTASGAATPTTSPSTSGGATQAASFGAAGIVGAAVIALLA